MTSTVLGGLNTRVPNTKCECTLIEYFLCSIDSKTSFNCEFTFFLFWIGFLQIQVVSGEKQMSFKEVLIKCFLASIKLDL